MTLTPRMVQVYIFMPVDYLFHERDHLLQTVCDLRDRSSNRALTSC